jgi:predicted transcriptional regulator
MVIQLKCPSYDKLNIIVLMRNFRIITFTDQKIYKNIFSFKRAMKELHKRGLINIRRINGSMNEYKITDKGQKISDALYELTA